MGKNNVSNLDQRLPLVAVLFNRRETQPIYHTLAEIKNLEIYQTGSFDLLCGWLDFCRHRILWVSLEKPTNKA